MRGTTSPQHLVWRRRQTVTSMLHWVNTEAIFTQASDTYSSCPSQVRFPFVNTEKEIIQSFSSSLKAPWRNRQLRATAWIETSICFITALQKRDKKHKELWEEAKKTECSLLLYPDDWHNKYGRRFTLWPQKRPLDPFSALLRACCVHSFLSVWITTGELSNTQGGGQG